MSYSDYDDYEDYSFNELENHSTDEYESELDFYIRTISKYPRINHKREKELSKIILHSGDQNKIEKAKEEMVLANLLLVVKQAQRYRNPSKRFTLSMMDVIEEGNIALMEAAEKYDGENESGAKFGTFATMLIRQRMTKAINESLLIRTPSRRNKIRYEINQLKAVYGDKISDEKIMEKLDINNDYLKAVRECHVTYLETMKKGTEEDEQLDWQSWLSDPNISPVSSKKDMLQYLRMKMFNELSEKERNIILDYYMNEERAFKDIGEKYGVSRERIRQIISKAIRKLRYSILSDWNKNLPKEEKIDRFAMCDLKVGTSRKDSIDEKEKYKYKSHFSKIIEDLTTESLCF